MRRIILSAVAVALSATAPAPSVAQSDDPGRLYGRVETTDGSTYEGYIRWGGNEAGVFDILHANKPIPERNRRDAERLGWEPRERGSRIEIFGIGFNLGEDDLGIGSSGQSGIRFGHISSLEVWGSNEARLLLKNGAEVTLDGGGDIGTSVSEILVEDQHRGQVELEWRDVRVIDFLAAPSSASRWGDRLYGTLTTRDGDRFRGYIAWDMDELFTSDVLDGEERGRDLEIAFARISAIERLSSREARVRFRDGGSVDLEGTNDVNDDNRDIMVADPALGEIRVEWDELDRVEFEAPPTALDESGTFRESHRLRGTVRARGGETHTGWIRWDNDEEYGWEILDGELVDGVDLDVEMGTIRSIERVSFDASRVTLRDGRSFVLGGSNDVDEGNRGVYVERSDGTLVLVPWDRFEDVTFDG